MAYQVRTTKAELETECRDLGLLENVNNYYEDTRVYKDDFIEALREYYFEKKYNNNIPKSLRLLDENLVSPMLAARYKKLKEDEQKAIWESDDWYLEEKEDGVRLLIPYFKEEGINFYSRNISVTDYLPISYKDTIYLREDFDESKITDDFILDSECISTCANINTIMEGRGVVTETILQAVQALLAMEPEKSIPIQKEETPFEFVAFDCMYWNGEWLFDKPLLERREYLLKGLKQMKNAGLNIRLPRSNRTNKEQFYKQILHEGGEGCIAKNINYKYIPNSYRRRDGWVKIKRNLSQLGDVGLGDTIDAFVTGWKKGTEGKKWENHVGALEFSIYLQDMEDAIFGDNQAEKEIHKIAVVAGIPDDLREEITEYDEEGNPKLKEEWYGKVAELDGMNISARQKRLKHARIIQWRSDKTPNECIEDEEWLLSMVM